MSLAPRFRLLTIAAVCLVALGALRPAYAQAPTIVVDTPSPIPFHGLRPTDVTLQAQALPTDTSLTISDKTPLKVGLIVELSYQEIMEITALSGDGPGGVADTMTVVRPLFGTATQTHAAGTVVFADITRSDIKVTGLGPVDTGATLAVSVDSDAFDSSGALLVSAIDASATTINVSDATLIYTQRKIRIDSEKMKVSGVTLGVISNSGAALEETVTSDSQTVMKISDKTKLGVGWRARIEALGAPPEEMLIVGLDGDGPGGAQDTMTVIRGSITGVLETGKPIYSGQDKATVQRGFDGTTAAAHGAGTGIDIDLRRMKISDDSLVGGGSTLQIDSEKMLAVNVPATSLRDTGASLTSEVLAGSTLLQISDASLVQVGWVVKLENERLAITDRTPGCAVGGGAATEEAIDASQEVIKINDRGLLNVGCAITLDTEQMKVVGLAGDGPGGAQDTMTVVRGFNDTTATEHGIGTISTAPHTMRAVRGFYGTIAAAHGTGPIQAFLEEPDTMRVARAQAGTTAQPHDAGKAILDVDGLGAYEFTLGVTAAETGAHLTGQVNSTTTTIPVDNTAVLQVGWTVIVESEKMRITGLGTGAMEVERGSDGTGAAEHGPGPIRGPVVVDPVSAKDGSLLKSTGRSVSCPEGVVRGVENLRFGCSTPQGGLPLGPSGDGVLAQVTLSGRALLPYTPSQAVTLSPVTLLDVSGNAIPHQATPAGISVIKCPDVNGNRLVTNTDAVFIAQAYFGIIPLDLDTQDLNLNGYVTNADSVLAKKVLFLSEPQPVRCPPPAS